MRQKVVRRLWGGNGECGVVEFCIGVGKMVVEMVEARFALYHLVRDSREAIFLR